MDGLSLLVLVAAFLLVTVVSWALLVLYCCIASSCSLTRSLDVLSPGGNVYEEPVSLVGVKSCDVQPLPLPPAYQYAGRCVRLLPPTAFPCQVYFGSQYATRPFPPPLPCRNRPSRLSSPIGDVVYV